MKDPAAPPERMLPDSVERRIRALLARGLDPFYFYDTGRIRRACSRFLAIPWEPKSILFATMANPHPSFLNLVREERLGVFVNSLVHLRAVRQCGFDGGEVAFAASAMDERTMREVQGAGAMVNLDSPGQVALWTSLFPDAPFGLRCNIGGMVDARNTRGGYFIGKESRLGLVPEEILSVAGHPRVEGLHLYAGTDIGGVGYFEECYEALARFVPAFPGLRYVDFGGGFCLEDESGGEFDFESYGAMVGRLMRRLSAGAGKRILMVLEPGRIIGGGAGWFVCRVTDVKARNGRQLVGVNASSSQFPRPLLYPESARHPVEVLHSMPMANGGPARPSDVYGCSTYSRDFLAREVLLPRTEIGDVIVLGNAGCYCAAMCTQFLGFQPPIEIYDDCETSDRKVGSKDILRSSP